MDRTQDAKDKAEGIIAHHTPHPTAGRHGATSSHSLQHADQQAIETDCRRGWHQEAGHLPHSQTYLRHSAVEQGSAHHNGASIAGT